MLVNYLFLTLSVTGIIYGIFILKRVKEKANPRYTAVIYPTITGVCFGGANLCNTILAGRMASSVVFPLQNISTILLSTLLGIVIFKEKVTARTAVIIILSVTAVILFSI